ncbi:MAG: type II toxin-antitoxin system VapC family toxin [Hymenobacter sp.]|nr:type II toxin-antitoxin system VapC family toxin [Hymenobacter sp.]
MLAGESFNAETRRVASLQPPGAEKLTQTASERCTVLPLNEFVVARTIQLRQQYRIKLPDAIIGATVLVHGLTLVTRNVRDFQQLPGIKVLDPYDPTQLPA